MSYLAGTDLAFELSLTDADGNPIDATSVEYRVSDSKGRVLQESTSVANFAGGSEVAITIPAALNVLTTDQPKDVREISFICTLADGSKKSAWHIYFIESTVGSLVRGSNTMVSLAGAELLAEDIPSIKGWKSASRQTKQAALLEAYRRLGKLRFTAFSGFHYDLKDSFKREEATSLLDLSTSEVLALDTKMTLALSLAQVSEADSILSGDSADSRRQEGLVLETVGEVKQMFRNGKPIELPVSRRTLGYVSKYMTVGSKVIGRT